MRIKLECEKCKKLRVLDKYYKPRGNKLGEPIFLCKKCIKHCEESE